MRTAHRRLRLLLLTLLASCAPATVRADVASTDAPLPASSRAPDSAREQEAPVASCRSASEECVAVGRWNFSIGLGLGVRTDPLAGERNIPLVLVPQLSYYGDRFFLDNLDFGWSLTETRSSTLSLVATPGYDRVFFDRGDPQNFFVSNLGNTTAGATPVTQTLTGNAAPPPSNHPAVTYLAGPEWTFQNRGVSGQLDLLHEITGHNHGNEVRAALGVPLVDGRNRLVANLGLTWKSSDVVDYFYGVPGVYRPGAALNPFLKLGFSAPLKGKWRLTALVHGERLDDSIARSPVVSQRYVLTIFAGATRAF